MMWIVYSIYRLFRKKISGVAIVNIKQWKGLSR